MGDDDCAVCVTAYDAHAHARVTCPYCTRATCAECVERFVLMHAMEPRCALCNKGWPPAVIDVLLSPKFRKGPLRKRRVAALLEHERTLLADTQAAAAAVRRARDVKATHKAVATLREAFQFHATERLRVKAAAVDRFVKHAAEARATDVQTHPDLRAAATLRAAALAAASKLRDEVERIPPVAPSVAAVAAVAAAFDAAAAATSVARAYATSPAAAATCTAVKMDTARLLAAHGMESEAADMAAVAAALHTVTDADLAKFAAQRAHAAELGALEPLPAAGGGVGHVEMTDGGNFVCKCPVSDCRGSVRKDTWQCAMCAAVVCKDCRERVAAAGHECDTAILANVRAIEADIRSGDTKPCPACFALVSRKWGCNHMWCTHCHTAFDFASGAKLRGYFHNPEHADWVEKNRIAPTAAATAPTTTAVIDADACDNPLGRAWTAAATANLSAQLASMLPAATAGMTKIADRAVRQHVMALVAAHRCCVEVSQMIPDAEYNAGTYQALRVDVLLGDLTDATWEAALVASENKRERDGHVRSALEVLLVVGAEHIGHLTTTPPTTAQDALVRLLSSTLAQLEAARVYVNEQLADIRTRFGGSKLEVDATWTIRGH